MDKIKQIAKRLFFILFFLTVSSWLPALCDYKPKPLFTKDCKKESKEYLVKAVFDGDTILIRTGETAMGRYGEKIRLLGIDAYEYDQEAGKIAKEYLTMLLLNKNVCVETDVQEKDIYDRSLGYVFSDKKLINEELLKSGHAILSNFPPNIKYISRLKKAQIYARENMLGIWEKEDFIKETPAQWRKRHPYKKKQI